MTEARKIKIKNRLGDLMRQPGGRSVQEALQGAQKRMDKISDQVRSGLDQSIARMDAVAGRLTSVPDDAALTEIYRAANDMIAVAALVGFKSIDTVAHGLCDLIDVFRAESLWSEQAIRVHVDAVLLLRSLPKADEAGQGQVLAGLEQIWSRFGVRQAAEPAAKS